jgi:hypothetical protein
LLTIKKETLTQVKLYIHPPLSYQMTSNRESAFVVEQEINQGETLLKLFARLKCSNPEAWHNIINVETGQIQPFILTILNNSIWVPSVESQTPLSDGDQITIRIIYAGG